jgi:hypothetical protein
MGLREPGLEALLEVKEMRAGQRDDALLADGEVAHADRASALGLDILR